MVPFPYYCTIKNNYCIAYAGHCKDYLVQLRILRPIIESQFKGIEIFICCLDEYVYIFNGEDKIVPMSQFDSIKNKFAYVNEIKCDMENHPILKLIEESSIEIPLKPIINNKSGICLIVPNGILPTRSLNLEEIKKISNKYKNLGYKTTETIIYKEAEMVVGVESETLFESAAIGKPTTLISTGLGTKLFKKIFPQNEIIMQLEK